MTNILDIHRTGGRRRGRRAERARQREPGEPRPRWTAPEAAPAAVTAEDSGSAPSPAPAFRRLVVFGSVDATAKRPAT
jgi:hypothetical protein